MTWQQRYQWKWAIRWSLWLMPLLTIGLVLIVAPLLRWLDRETEMRLYNFTPDGSRTILGAFTASMLTFVVFVLSSLLIVVQLASAQLTPRIIARVLADPRLKLILSIFTFSYTFTIAVSGRIETTVPQLSVTIAILFNLMCLALFFWYVQWLGASLRPIAVLQSVADEGCSVVESVYPEPFDPAEVQAGRSPLSEAGIVVVEHIGTSGVVMAFDMKFLLNFAERLDLVIEFVPQVGDFVARGDPLFRVHNCARLSDGGVLRTRVAIGSERTLEQDPRFAFRIMVDIANKALSPAINDPTTAVLAVDQIHRLLMHIGKRRLDAGEVRDGKGQIRLCYGTPNWIDFVSLAVTEIRHFGVTSMQVARRLHAMLVHLMSVLPDARRAALQQELDLLQQAILRSFPDEADRVRAQIGDFQGIGSSETP